MTDSLFQVDFFGQSLVDPVRRWAPTLAGMEAWTERERAALGARLAAARKAAGQTQSDVGALFRVSKQNVSKWESGENMPNAEQIARLADEFRVSPTYLLLGQDTAWPFGDRLAAEDIAGMPDDLLHEAIGELKGYIREAQRRLGKAASAGGL